MTIDPLSFYLGVHVSISYKIASDVWENWDDDIDTMRRRSRMLRWPFMTRYGKHLFTAVVFLTWPIAICRPLTRFLLGLARRAS